MLLRTIKYLVCLLFIVSGFVSCSEDVVDNTVPHQGENTLLVYMVATNTLMYDARDDLNEIRAGMASLPESTDVLVYYASLDVDKDGPVLYRVGHDGQLIVLKKYDMSVSSLAPVRISGVIDDARHFSHANTYGLVLWSHATGWLPSSSPVTPVSFGSDYKYHLDIDRLAEAIPDRIFDFIWCDCCYMSSIEVIYQLRNKCRLFVASPTPLMNCGMPYDLTLPYLVADSKSLAEAARLSYASIMAKNGSKGYTLAITDMSKIEELANAAKGIFSSWKPVSAEGLQSYSPDNIGPFYDFLQYARKVADAAGCPDKAIPLEDAISKAVVFKLSTPDFMGLKIEPSLFSGLSVHMYSERQNDAENFYRSLDWYRDVFLDD